MRDVDDEKQIKESRFVLILDWRRNHGMEDFLELILTILFLPFESKEERIVSTINHINSKPLRVFLKLLIPLFLFCVVFGLYSLCSYLIRGYWI